MCTCAQVQSLTVRMAAMRKELAQRSLADTFARGEQQVLAQSNGHDLQHLEEQSELVRRQAVKEVERLAALEVELVRIEVRSFAASFERRALSLPRLFAARSSSKHTKKSSRALSSCINWSCKAGRSIRKGLNRSPSCFAFCLAGEQGSTARA